MYMCLAYTCLYGVRKIAPRKIAPWSESGFGLGLALVLGLGAIFLGGNFPRTVCTNLVSVILRKIYVIFIYKSWHYNLASVNLKKIKNIFTPI